MMNTRCFGVSSDGRHRAIIAATAMLPTMLVAQTLPPPPVSPAPVTGLEYTAQGLAKRTIVAPGTSSFTTSHEYDRLQRRTLTTDARAKSTAFGYTAGGELRQVVDPRSLVTQYPRNGLGDQTGLVSPDTGTETHTLDAAGNLRTRVDSRGVSADHSYDAMNRLTAVNHTKAGEPSQLFEWRYDQQGSAFGYGVGRLTSFAFPGGSATFAYDALGRLISTTQSVTSTYTATLTTGYQYDLAGRVAAVVYPSGRVLNISRTGGLPSAMSLTPAGGGTPIGLLSNMQFNADPTGGVVARAWAWRLDGGGSLAYERHFDTYGRAIRYPVGGAVRDLSYDSADRIISYRHWDATNGVEVTALNQSFGYDELSRLTGVATAQGTWSIAYDDNGNRSSVAFTVASTTTTRGYSTPATSNRLAAMSSPTRLFAHDPAGNTVSDTEGFRSLVFSIDLSGRVSRIYATPDGLTYVGTGYVQDNFGRRVLKLNQGGETCSAPPSVLRTCLPQMAAAGLGVVYVYDQGGRLLGEYRLQDGAVLREYVWLDDMPVAVIDGVASAATVYYLYTDHLGTPRVAIDTLGRQRWSWMAEPFGNSSPNESPLGLPQVQFNLRMPGQYFDSESGLAYNWHRTYDGTLGRYTQSDPIGLAGGINTYAYVDGNPLSYADPTGLVKHSSGQWIECGKNCRIRIDSVLDESTGARRRHVHWECRGSDGSCGERGDKSHGTRWEDAPKAVQECARRNGFDGGPVPVPPMPAAGAPSPSFPTPQTPNDPSSWPNPFVPPAVYDPVRDTMVPGRRPTPIPWPLPGRRGVTHAIQ